MNTLKPIISASELLNLMNHEEPILIDAGSGPAAKENYLKNHLKGALYFDLNEDLSSIQKDASQGGRHPLPSPAKFAKTLSKLGIRKCSHVIIYDMNQGANAGARLWWMLKSIGHEKVQVLNGGQQAAEQLGFPMSSAITHRPESNYIASEWTLPMAEIDEVEMASHSKDHTIVDVRGMNRYQGIEEPFDLIAGHIPNAINIPYSENLDEHGNFKSPVDLRSIYSELYKRSAPKDMIIHCGSGVTACHTILALQHAEMELPKLYVGSWSEWSRNNKEMITR
jgi:thiosulfate/3-mercaptopyruvate sulfurtransferase